MKVLVVTQEQEYTSKQVRTTRTTHNINHSDELTALRSAVAHTLEARHGIVDRSLFTMVEEKGVAFGHALTFADAQETIVSAWII